MFSESVGNLKQKLRHALDITLFREKLCLGNMWALDFLLIEHCYLYIKSGNQKNCIPNSGVVIVSKLKIHRLRHV